MFLKPLKDFHLTRRNIITMLATVWYTRQ